MLRDVTTRVSDGLLGFATETGDGVHVKIGVSPVQASAPVAITGSMDAAGIRQVLGLSPLADAAMDAVQWGAGRIWCIPVMASGGGTIGEISREGKGTGTVAATGSPSNAFQVTVEITAQGGLNTAAFRVSIDGGYSYTDETTVPVTGTYDLEGTGLTLRFTETAGEDQKAGSFLAGDRFSFRTEAPTATNGDILEAFGKLKDFSREFEFVHVAGPAALPLWQAVSEVQQELMDRHHKPFFVLLEAGLPETGEGKSFQDWAIQMEADRKKVRNRQVQVCAAWGRMVRLDGTVQNVNLAGAVSGRYASTAVHKSIGQTSGTAGMGFPRTKLLELLPEGCDSSVIKILDEAGYLTFRGYDGLDDYFVYHTKMMCPDGSDYRYAEDVRVLNKIIREIRKKSLLLMNDDIGLDDIQGELETRAKFISEPLDTMVDSGEISDYETTVAGGHEDTFLEDETMRIKIRYQSRGYIREVEIDLGRAPADGG